MEINHYKMTSPYDKEFFSDAQTISFQNLKVKKSNYKNTDYIHIQLDNQSPYNPTRLSFPVSNLTEISNYLENLLIEINHSHNTLIPSLVNKFNGLALRSDSNFWINTFSSSSGIKIRGEFRNSYYFVCIAKEKLNLDTEGDIVTHACLYLNKYKAGFLLRVLKKLGE